MGRDRYWDSLKFVLISLVVFGHVIGFLGDRSKLNVGVYNIIYTFHMPLFFFISGFFSKSTTWISLKKAFLTFLPIYFLFQIALNSLNILEGNIPVWYSFILYPIQSMWYIPALLLSRTVAFAISKTKININFYLVFSIILSLTIGFLHLGKLHPISKGFYFLPFFLLGYIINEDYINRIKKINKMISLIILICIFTSIYIYANNKYILVAYGTPYAWISNIDLTLGLYYRIGMIILTVIISICILNITSPIFCKFGERTLDIYLIHSIIIYIFIAYIANKYQFMNSLNIFYCIIISILLMYVSIKASYLKPVQYLINPYSFFKNKL